MELFQAFLTLAAVCTVAGLRSTSGRQICRDAQGRSTSERPSAVMHRAASWERDLKHFHVWNMYPRRPRRVALWGGPFGRHAPGRRVYNGVCAMPAQYAISAH